MRRILTFMVAILCACMVAQAHQTANNYMKLQELLKNIEPIQIIGDVDVEVSGINIDSRKIKEGHLFVKCHSQCRKIWWVGIIILLIHPTGIKPLVLSHKKRNL